MTEQAAAEPEKEAPADLSRQPAEVTQTRLAGPKSVNEVADLINKIVFGFCTIAIAFAVFLLNNSIDEGNRRKELYTFLADTPPEVVTSAQIQKVGFLKKVCYSYLLRVHDDGAEELCKALPPVGGATVQAVSRDTAAVAERLARDRDAGRYLASPQATNQSSLVAAAETVVTAGKDQWFAVVGTVPIDQKAAADALASQVARLIPGDLLNGRAIRIYRTKISNSFAITVGDAMGKDDATKLASSLRKIPTFNDAFAQPDRDWTRVSPPPES
ncbi:MULTISPECIES: hypothetical protein [unclassified Novosphingobium]|uniref:hypothetical protein n=1 Tax=unclassified Novosphingobium TaxID=2644732 RepID=UPI001469BF4E|nr:MULTISPECIES: hypothetical protein [unclassified Novosphingobium]NMN06794.1 hypothetical protein [Novosphingobium sp. SG919]NMN88755.1 hypothetical protein [Novosphingobium sp. SG916]